MRRGGKPYKVTPCALLWDDEKYYLVAFDEEEGIIKNFRVDKMAEICIEDEKRDSAVVGGRFNPAEYSKKVFGMYGGKEELVTIECRERLAGVMIDRFGKDVSFFKTPFGFRMSVRVMLSPNFYGWLLGFGDELRVLSPESVKESFISRLENVMRLYKE